MSRLPNRGAKPFLRQRVANAVLAAALAATALASAAFALPGNPALGKAETEATLIQPVRGGACQDSCPDCAGCPTEIDITPGPYHQRGREDPIGHAIKRLEPSPLLAPDSCPETGAERRGDASSGCGIRCWYWRLRYGYCGPGCDYYRYRLGSRERFPDPVVPQYHHRACKS
jgi:hypothetical protein